MLSEKEIIKKLEEMEEEYDRTGNTEYKGNVEALEWVLEVRGCLN